MIIIMTIITFLISFFILYIIWYFLLGKSIKSKKWIEDSMTEKYGEDWLEQCLEALKNPEIKQKLKKDLKL